MTEHQRPSCATCVFYLESTCECHLHPPKSDDKGFASVDMGAGVLGCSQWTTPEAWAKNIEFAQLRVEFEIEQVRAAFEQLQRQNSSLAPAMLIPNMRKQ